MKYPIDVHTHSIVSGHAYTSLLENVKEAASKGIVVLGSSEHGPKMPGGPHIFYFSNIKCIPRKIEEVIILRGCESNIIDYKGTIDLPEKLQRHLDYIIASFHDVCIEPGSIVQNTNALLEVIKNPYVDIIGHMGNPCFPVDIEAVVFAAKKHDKIIEINSSSPKSRRGSLENCTTVAELCKKHGVKVMLSSDAHISYDIGKFDDAIAIIEEAQLPESLVMNSDWRKFLNYLKGKNKLSDLTI